MPPNRGISKIAFFDSAFTVLKAIAYNNRKEYVNLKQNIKYIAKRKATVKMVYLK